MTLSLGGNNSNGVAAGALTSNSEKLINIDPVTASSSKMNRDGASSHRPPPPPPRISSDPNNPVNLNKNLINGDSKSLAENLPVSVTHFSPATNGVGLEKETIFTEENGMDSTASHVNGLIDSTPKAKNTNPFLTNSSESSPDNEPSAVFRSQSRKENNNYENVRMFPVQGETTSSGGNPFTAKFNTIGRSNPFSSVKGGSPSRNNPFLDTNGSSCDNGENNHVTIQTNSPDASIDPTPILQPAILKHKQNQNGYDLVDSRRNGVGQSGSKANKSVSTA